MATSKSEVVTPSTSKSPTEIELLKQDALIEIRTRTVDNPGKGNCGFYAFAIGLINIIQEEKASGRRTMFDRWVRLDDSITQYYDAICNYDIDRPDYELLENLHRALRLTTYRQQFDELRRVCPVAKKEDRYKDLVATSTYRKFAELYYGRDVDPRFNELASSAAIRRAIARIDRSTVVEEREALVLAPVFLALFYGEGVALDSITAATEPSVTSPIIESLQGVTKDYVWANHLDLDYLANAFEVNLHTLENGNARYPFHDLVNRHTIILNNQSNVHWTTQVAFAKVSKGMLADNSTIASKKGASPSVAPKSRAPGKEKDAPVLAFSTEKEKPIIREDTTGKDLAVQGKDGSGTKEAEPKHEVVVRKEQGKKIDNSKKQRTSKKQSEIPLTILGASAESKKLDFLISKVRSAVVEYCKHSESIWFCFFHWHGETGRKRARDFLSTFSQVEHCAEAQEMLIDYLKNDSKGNTHPHSFRTMLLKELLDSPTEKKMDLNNISKNYQTTLKQFEKSSSSVSFSDVVATIW
jgi:hypothetical protein